jgi:phage gpG-like protein
VMKFKGFQNKKAVIEKMQKIASSTEEIAFQELANTALQIHADVVQSIHQHKSKGPAERRYNPRRIHRPSLPGSPPNSDLGTLAKSYMFEVNEQTMTAKVGSNLKYAAWLEFGTKHVQARPHLLPAFKRQVALLQKRYVKDLKNKVKGWLK